MDMETMMKLLMSSDALGQVGKQAGVTEKEASDAMKIIVPMLLKGMQGQAQNVDTQAGFLEALASHGKDDTKDVSKFLSNVDTEDGGKIVKHLLGAQEEELAAKAKKKSGIDTKKIIKIMAIVAPLLMAQMGKQAKAKSGSASQGSASDVIGIIGGLMDGIDASDVFKIVGALMK
ncbi:MAG: DUF937 domain-containing protein [Clostridiales bacterium]|nr:DUF937 domain-containing protein [Clostridiales bacterium]